MTVYVGIGTRPNFTDPASYLFAVTYNTSALVDAPQSIYLPASLCPATSASALQSGCPIMLSAAVVGPSYVYALVEPMSSTGEPWLQPGQVVGATTQSSGVASYFQLSMPAAPAMVTLSVTSAGALSVICSYRFVRPSLTFNDWMVTNTSAAAQSPQLRFQWPTPRLNSLSGVAQIAYCGVASLTSSSTPYTFSFSYSSSPPPGSSRSSLSGGALFAAVFLPIVGALLLVVLTLWLHRRSGCGMCGEVVKQRMDSDGSLSELQSVKGGGRQLLHDDD